MIWAGIGKLAVYAAVVAGLTIIGAVVESLTGFNVRFMVGWLSAFVFLGMWPGLGWGRS